MVLGLLLLLATPAVSAHAAGSPPITQNGVIELAPVANQTGSAYHANITNLGIPPGPGDTLRFSWSANAGDGPAIHFEIHSHSGPNNYTEYYSIPLAVRDDDSWTVPAADTYMVLWSNPSTKFVNVTYNFTLLGPPPPAPRPRAPRSTARSRPPPRPRTCGLPRATRDGSACRPVRSSSRDRR